MPRSSEFRARVLVRPFLIGLVATVLHLWHMGSVERQIKDAVRFASTPEFALDPGQPSKHTFDLTGWPEEGIYVSVDLLFERDRPLPGSPVPIEAEVHLVDRGIENSPVFEAAEPREGTVQHSLKQQVNFLGWIEASGPVTLEFALRPTQATASFSRARIQLAGHQDSDLLVSLDLEEGFGKLLYAFVLAVALIQFFTLLFPSRRPTAIAQESLPYAGPPPFP